MPRPLTPIDEEQFENLCELQCTLSEIAGFFKCSEDTIERWCRRTYDAPFRDVYAMKSRAGLISLRRRQFKLADTNAAMAIFLGKQYLGQSDDPQRQAREKTAEDKIASFIDALASAARDGDA